VIACEKLEPSPWVPPRATLTLRVSPVRRSCTKASSVPLVSCGTRFVAEEVKATKRPSAEISAASSPLVPFACPSVEPTLARSVRRGSRSCQNTSPAASGAFAVAASSYSSRRARTGNLPVRYSGAASAPVVQVTVA
jgi:hypothetical protein